MHKVAVMTTTRAEYGLLKPVLTKIKADVDLDLKIIVGGTHLSEKWGKTVTEIEKDGFEVSEKVYAFPKEDNALAISKSMAKTMLKVAEIIERVKPDFFLVLGDRYEIFAAVTVAYTMGIPVGHVAGGEVTVGALDEAYRHGITKMARIHFVANEIYRRRVIQLGEQPENVFLSGDTGSENIRNMQFLSKEELSSEIGFPMDKPYILATYHPVTLEENDCEKEMKELFSACEAFPEMNILFTMANADSNGQKINETLRQYAEKNSERIFLYTSLGQLRYLSAMKHCALVLGNSSSGILEAPTMGVPSVNIGSRQEGRLKAHSVIDSEPVETSIKEAIKKVISDEFKERLINLKTEYNQVTQTSDIIVREIKRFLKEKNRVIGKRFYDIPNER